MAERLLGIDWGTSNRRAYLVERGGECRPALADHEGSLASKGRFAEALDQLRAQLQLDAAVPVVMSGMVGSQLGWQEVPYLDCSVPIDALPRHLAAVRERAGCFIVPGYRGATPSIDVMRGEETQLLGAVAMGKRDGWFILPGTHSKWVRLANGRIEHLATFMTGELYALLGEKGTLSGLMQQGQHDAEAFAEGVEEARRGQPLSHALFGVRARVVTGAMPATRANAFVSGLLIGAEFVHADDHVHVIGSATLARLYETAAAMFGMRASALDPDLVYCAAMRAISSELP